MRAVKIRVGGHHVRAVKIRVVWSSCESSED